MAREHTCYTCDGEGAVGSYVCNTCRGKGKTTKNTDKFNRRSWAL